MNDFDTCDKYVLLLEDLAKNPGFAISTKQFKNLDALIEVATFDLQNLQAHLSAAFQQRISATCAASPFTVIIFATQAAAAADRAVPSA